jgi:ribosome-associated protein
MRTFDLSGDYIELNKLLKASGFCGSGGEANAAISGGMVRVNGERETRKRRKLRGGDVVEMAGKTISIN